MTGTRWHPVASRLTARRKVGVSCWASPVTHPEWVAITRIPRPLSAPRRQPCAGLYLPDGRGRRGRVAITRFVPPDPRRPAPAPAARGQAPRPPARGWGCTVREKASACGLRKPTSGWPTTQDLEPRLGFKKPRLGFKRSPLQRRDPVQHESDGLRSVVRRRRNGN